jgi:hypothetical protein
LAERVDKVTGELEGLEAGVANLDTDVQLLHEDLSSKTGVPVSFIGQTADVEIVAPGGVEVSNPPDLATVKAAVDQNSETFDSNAWAIAGLFVGLGALAWIWKLVRP